MEVFRLAREKYSKLLSGKGAAIKGARWNSPGVELIYCAANRSLAMAEVAVHFTLATLPDDYVMLSIFIPDDVAFQKLNKADLPSQWNTFPAKPETRQIGDQLVFENRFCILKVPSAVTKGDYNYLINPGHPDFKKMKITEVIPFPFDERIFEP